MQFDYLIEAKLDSESFNKSNSEDSSYVDVAAKNCAVLCVHAKERDYKLF